MSSRTVKKKILALLAGPDLSNILAELKTMRAKDVINSLFSAISRSEENIRWHAVSCMGATVARLADKDMEEARIVMRRLLWSLNDESGGIGWGAPESMAEIMVCHEGLAREYVHMLFSYLREDGEELFQDGNFLEHEILQRGLLWGIGRLAVERPEMVSGQGIEDHLRPYLQSLDASVRGLAARCLGLLKDAKAMTVLRPIMGDTDSFSLYGEGFCTVVSVGELVCRALDRIESRES